MESKSSPSLIPIPANHLRIIKTVVVPYFITIYMADSEAADPWRSLSPKDFDILQELCLRACGEPLEQKIDENAEIVTYCIFRTFSIVLRPSRDSPACSRPLSRVFSAIPIRSVSFRCHLICPVTRPFRVSRLIPSLS